jgi:putative membrane protein
MPTNDPEPQLLLRDVLALDRTSLANERTMLAYVRTAVGLVAGGIGLAHIISATWADVMGWSLATTGVVFAVVGAVRFVMVRRTILKQTHVVPP